METENYEYVKQLKLEDGDILVLRLKEPVPNESIESMYRTIKKMFERSGKKASVMILNHKFGEVEKFDTETMKKFGWERSEEKV